jgi:hypothetical protein
MPTKHKKDQTKQSNKSGAEKPISLWGASLPEVIQALLRTKPEPKKKVTGKKKSK